MQDPLLFCGILCSIPCYALASRIVLFLHSLPLRTVFLGNFTLLLLPAFLLPACTQHFGIDLPSIHHILPATCLLAHIHFHLLFILLYV